jgi:hypothetical protein
VYADEMDARGSISEVSLLKVSPKFTCFTSTKVQILTLSEVSTVKLMERNRNTALGGAVELARLQV